METEPYAGLHAVISGEVQGVGFRYFVQNRASDLNLTGWVRNLYSGEVEVLAEGPRSQLDILLAELRNGPAHAHVDHVDFDWLAETGKYRRFFILSTV